MDDASKCEQEYYELLDEFIGVCRDCVSAGQPYVAVLMCHELFRFLYPVEPFAGFVQEEPVTFAVDHIRKLVETGRVMRASIAPYAWKPGGHGEDVPRALEVATSDLYSSLWTGFGDEELVNESTALLSRRLPASVVAEHVVGKRVLDMGCGSGRYAIALQQLGAASVDAVDVQSKSFADARAWCERKGVAVHFQEGNVHDLPFDDGSFDFVFCNGVLHHTSSVDAGIGEMARVMKSQGAAFLYLYGSGGIFWNTRVAMRTVFADIPVQYTQSVLQLIGMPSKRFIFCDTWYVPVETLTSRPALQQMLNGHGLRYRKLHGENPFDLDRIDLAHVPGASNMWGDGEHRYFVEAGTSVEHAAC